MEGEVGRKPHFKSQDTTEVQQPNVINLQPLSSFRELSPRHPLCEMNEPYSWVPRMVLAGRAGNSPSVVSVFHGLDAEPRGRTGALDRRVRERLSEEAVAEQTVRGSHAKIWEDRKRKGGESSRQGAHVPKS